jgi:hypothetical protein
MAAPDPPRADLMSLADVAAFHEKWESMKSPVEVGDALNRVPMATRRQQWTDSVARSFTLDVTPAFERRDLANIRSCLQKAVDSLVTGKVVAQAEFLEPTVELAGPRHYTRLLVTLSHHVSGLRPGEPLVERSVRATDAIAESLENMTWLPRPLHAEQRVVAHSASRIAWLDALREHTRGSRDSCIWSTPELYPAPAARRPGLGVKVGGGAGASAYGGGGAGSPAYGGGAMLRLLTGSATISELPAAGGAPAPAESLRVSAPVPAPAPAAALAPAPASAAAAVAGSAAAAAAAAGGGGGAASLAPAPAPPAPAPAPGPQRSDGLPDESPGPDTGGWGADDDTSDDEEAPRPHITSTVAPLTELLRSWVDGQGAAMERKVKAALDDVDADWEALVNMDGRPSNWEILREDAGRINSNDDGTAKVYLARRTGTGRWCDCGRARACAEPLAALPRADMAGFRRDEYTWKDSAGREHVMAAAKVINSADQKRTTLEVQNMISVQRGDAGREHFVQYFDCVVTNLSETT